MASTAHVTKLHKVSTICYHMHAQEQGHVSPGEAGSVSMLKNHSAHLSLEAHVNMHRSHSLKADSCWKVFAGFGLLLDMHLCKCLVKAGVEYGCRQRKKRRAVGDATT